MNPETVVRKFLAAYSRHDLDAYYAMLDPKYVSHDPLVPNPPKGKEVYRKMTEYFFKAFPDVKFKILNIAAKGGFVAAEVVYAGTFKGPVELRGRTIPPTGSRFEAKAAMFVRVNSKGLIAENRYYYDPADFLQQLGMKA